MATGQTKPRHEGPAKRAAENNAGSSVGQQADAPTVDRTKTMHQRHDGSSYPNAEADTAVLSNFTDEDLHDSPGYDYGRTLGDLIILALVGRDLREGGYNDPDSVWETLEHALLDRTALELRVLGVAMSGGGDDDDDLTVEHFQECVRGLSWRVRAGAELAKRLRVARWGHPCFGGTWDRGVDVNSAEGGAS